MVNKLFGKKMGMTRHFMPEGASVPVTIIKLGPCIVMQIKTKDKDGYNAIQVGFEPQKERRLNKPLREHQKKASGGSSYFSELREIKVDDPESFELGQEIKAEIFKAGETVNISGKSKGRGFSGVMKRWGFAGGRKTHGSRSHRIPGSIGCSATPGRVLKGKKLPGRMGNQRVTIKNLKLIEVRPELDMIMVKGCVPGSKTAILEVSRA